MNNDSRTRIVTALVWCLTWGKKHNLSHDELSTLRQMRQALANERENKSDRTCEGFGQVEICNEFHQVFREEAK
ncbi:MAG: hypothetical protein IGR91_19445 [Fischerella thermalis M66_A2018_004]|nr:hypothetical protein [Fischerella thermalis M66_A2018_004]